MVYTKTNWVDNATPLSAANLNKMEEGIFDAQNYHNVYNATLASNLTITKDGIRDILSVTLPAGTYLVYAHMTAQNVSGAILSMAISDATTDYASTDAKEVASFSFGYDCAAVITLVSETIIKMRAYSASYDSTAKARDYGTRFGTVATQLNAVRIV